VTALASPLGTDRAVVTAATAIVDAHTHTFPAELVADRGQALRRDPWFAQLYATPKAAMIDGPGLLAAMATAGVAQAVVCGFPWRDPGLCRIHNDDMAAAAARSGGRLSWLGTVSPMTGLEAAQEAARCFELGAVGLGELNADAQGFDLSESTWLAPLAEVCQLADRPLLLHASEPVGHAYPGKGTATPAQLLRFLVAFPHLRVVLAHWGGGLPFYELMPEVAAATARVVYDSAASTYLYRPAVFRTVLELVGRERVLFGSDHPVLRVDRFLSRVRAAGVLRRDEEGPVLGGNAMRVYGLPTLAAATSGAIPPMDRGEGDQA